MIKLNKIKKMIDIYSGTVDTGRGGNGTDVKRTQAETLVLILLFFLIE